MEDDHFTPSTRAVRNERALALPDALEKLPPDPRTAIELHHLQGPPVDEVGRLPNRKRDAGAIPAFYEGELIEFGPAEQVITKPEKQQPRTTPRDGSGKAAPHCQAFRAATIAPAVAQPADVA